MTGRSNFALGTGAMAQAIDASFNVAIGGSALRQNVSATNTVAIGSSALRENLRRERHHAAGWRRGVVPAWIAVRANGNDIMTEGIHWKTISWFESHDFVANWYRKAHGRDANAAKVRQINACFAHGREYFRNAGRSEMSVKPLLLYYGVLSCCRGGILAKDHGKKEESLKDSDRYRFADFLRASPTSAARNALHTAR